MFSLLFYLTQMRRDIVQTYTYLKVAFGLLVLYSIKYLGNASYKLWEQQKLSVVFKFSNLIYTTRKKESDGTVMWEKSCWWRQKQWGNIVHVLFHIQASCSLYRSYFHGN